MSSSTIATMVKMLESLPETTQERVLDHLREYLSDLLDEQEWYTQFKRSQPQLKELARRARQEIAEGKAKSLDLKEL